MMEVIFLAAIGFVGFEALRIYKIIVDGKKNPIPSSKILYSFTIIWLSVFSGIVAWAFDLQNRGLALYVGFSLPCSLKAFMKKELAFTSVEVDDIETLSQTVPIAKHKEQIRYFSWLKDYFTF